MNWRYISGSYLFVKHICFNICSKNTHLWRHLYICILLSTLYSTSYNLTPKLLFCHAGEIFGPGFPQRCTIRGKGENKNGKDAGWLRSRASYPAATARGCPGEVNLGAHNLRGPSHSCQPVWRDILMNPGSIAESCCICIDVCVSKLGHEYWFLKEKMEDWSHLWHLTDAWVIRKNPVVPLLL